MMPKIVDYFFAPLSPWAYMGHARFEAMALKHGAEIRYKPVDYGKIFPASGGVPVAQRPKQRQAYRLVELERWRDFLGIDLTLQPKHFPTTAQPAAKTIIAAKQSGAAPGRLAYALMRACWAEERDIGNAGTIVAVCREWGLDGAALVAAAETSAVIGEYDGNTAEAIERQVFGAPWFIYRDKPYWGQDRLDFLERALAAG
jgi:2-hydroxychromene-2-carboxylate isomerase